MQVLAVIPARGGSKGILGKNTAVVAGRPLIAWTIDVALRSQTLERVVVTTDSPQIAATARECGAEVPFMRPSELAADHTPGIAPVLHAVDWLEQHESYQPEWVMLLQPTSPLRTVEDVDAAVAMASKKDVDAVVSVCEGHQHPYWMKQIGSDGFLTDFLRLERPYARRQDLPPVYALNGAVYLIRRQVLLEQRTLYPARTMALVMPIERSLDVDTLWDLHLVRLVLEERMRHENR